MLCIAILRVSSHRQKDNTSHETQEAEVRSYAAEAGIEIDRVFHLVESAKATEARKKYHAALNYALKQKIGAILFYMHDREARNLTDNETNERLVRAGQIEIHYVRDRKVLNRNSPEFEYIMRDFMAVNNKWKERSDRERRDFLNELLSNPRLRGRTVEYDLKKPFAVLAEMAKKQDWRPQGDGFAHRVLNRSRVFAADAQKGRSGLFVEPCAREYSKSLKTKNPFG
jgi:predicted site-specific integrase-resolvase